MKKYLIIILTLISTSVLSQEIKVSQFKRAQERSLATKAKRGSLKIEADELKHTLSEMHYKFVKDELVAVLQVHQEAENQSKHPKTHRPK